MGETNWSPERKVVGAAIAVIIVGLIQILFEVGLDVGFEGAVAVVVAYLLPNKKSPKKKAPSTED